MKRKVIQDVSLFIIHYFLLFLSLISIIQLYSFLIHPHRTHTTSISEEKSHVMLFKMFYYLSSIIFCFFFVSFQLFIFIHFLFILGTLTQHRSVKKNVIQDASLFISHYFCPFPLSHSNYSFRLSVLLSFTKVWILQVLHYGEFWGWLRVIHFLAILHRLLQDSLQYFTFFWNY